MFLGEVVHVEVRVPLGHVNAAVAEEFLHVAKTGPGPEEMRRDRMA